MEPGQQVSHYRLASKIGGGGMGVVWKAEDTVLHRPVALKFLPPELAAQSPRIERFLEEARAASSINHPGIVQVHELGRHEGAPFIVMEYVEGRTLRDLARGGALRLRLVLDVMIQVTEALAAAHAKGIVHRDLKPDNIMLDEAGRARVLDFGLAKLLGEPEAGEAVSEQTTRPPGRTEPGAVVGTVHYLSPEQASGERVDARSDVFALGVVLYEMACGRRPFEGASRVEALGAILKEEPRPVSEVNPKVPAELQRVIEKALAKRPEDRYQDIKDLWVDLRRVRREQEARAAVALPAPQAPRRFRRRAAWTGVVLAVLTLLIGGAYLYRSRPWGGPAGRPSVAVVWFQNLGGDPQQAYLSEGMTEELITELWKIGGIKVNTLDEIRPFREREVSAREVARRLGYNYVLTGSIQRASDRVRVTPRLVNVSDASLAWTERFEDDFGGIFTLQDAIALRIARQLKVALSSQEERAIRAAPTESHEAYEHYLRGRHHYERTTFRDNELGEKEFRKALDLDAEYALALAGLADTYVQRYKERYDYDEIWLDEAKDLIGKALRLEPELAEAHESSAELLLEEENWLEALKAGQRARELRPGWDEPYVRLGEVRQERGERAEALEMFERAIAIRPSVEALCGKGSVLRTRGQMEAAEEAFRRAVEVNPDHDAPTASWRRCTRTWAAWRRPRPSTARRSRSARTAGRPTRA